MKTSKFLRVLAYTLAVLIILGGIPFVVPVIPEVSAAAPTSYTNITANSTASVSITSSGSAKYFRFVPTVSGTYKFYSSNYSGDPYGALLDANGTTLKSSDDDGGNRDFSFTYQCSAGTVYYIKAYMYSTNTGSYTLNVESVGWSPSSYTNITANSTASVSITSSGSAKYFRFVPTVSGTYKFYSSNYSGDPYGALLDANGTTLKSSDDDGGNRDFSITYQCSAGTVYYIKAYMYNTNTGSYTLNVQSVGWSPSSYTNITANSTASVSITSSGSAKYFRFVPTVSGTYKFYSSNYSGDPYGALLDANGTTLISSDDDGGNRDFSFTYQCSAGTVYYIKAHMYNTNTGSYTLNVESVGWSPSSYTNITANSTASVSITSSGNAKYFRFVPTVSGTYSFYSSNHSGDPYGALLDSTGETILTNDDGGTGYNFSFDYNCTANEVYYIKAYMNGSSTGSYTLHVVSSSGGGGQTPEGTVEVSSTGAYSLFNSGATSSGGYKYSGSQGVDANPDSHSYNNSGYDIYGQMPDYSTLTLNMGLSFEILSPVTERAALTVYAYDVDEESGERDTVYLVDETAGTRVSVGYLSGMNDQWNTTTLYIDSSRFTQGHVYHFETTISDTSGSAVWWVYIRTVSIEMSTSEPTPDTPVITDYDFDAYITSSGVVNTELFLKTSEDITYNLEYAATINGNQRGSALDQSIAVTSSGTSKNVSFALESGSPKGTYQISVVLKDSNGNTVTTYTTTAGYDFSAVSYDSNGGSNNFPIDQNAYSANDTVTVLFNYIPSRSGYTFLGWSTDRDAVVPEFTERGAKTFTIGSNDVTLYAVWGAEACDHEWREVSRTEPGCTTFGEIVYSCVCGQTRTALLDPIQHNYHTTSSADPTCTADGYIELTCTNSNCGLVKRQIIEKLGHYYGNDNVCDRCGHTIDIHTHIYTVTVVAPTCFEVGYTEYTCSCGFSYRDLYVEPIRHDWNDGVVTVEKTCISDGLITYTCNNCGSEKNVVIEAGHEWSDTVVVEKTCTTDGMVTKTCTVCFETVTEVVPAGHNWDEGIVTLEPSCEEDGIKTCTCLDCRETQTFAIPALGHEYRNGVCVRCGERYIDNITPSDHPLYGMYFEIDDIISDYGPSLIDEYGVMLDYNSDANIEKVAVYLIQDGIMWRRCIAVTGTNIEYATYVPYLSYESDIKYTGLNHDWINIFQLNENSDGIWCYSNYATIGVNLEDAYGNLLLSLYDIGQAGAETRIFDDLSEMIAWLKDEDVHTHTPGHAATCTQAQTCTDCGDIIVSALGHNFVNDVCTRCGETNITADIWDGTVDTSWYNSSETVFTIYTAEQLAGFARLVNNRTAFSGKTVRLANDIDLCNLEWTPIGWLDDDGYGNAFEGVFDGNYKTVYNLKITGEKVSAGLFGGIKNATVSCLAVLNADIDVYYDLNPISAGAICGAITYSSVQYCHATGNVSARSAKLESSHRVAAGLIVGYLDGVSNISDCYAEGNVTGEMTRKWNSYVGGIVGAEHSGDDCTVRNCYFSGTVTAKAVDTSYAGGIIGVDGVIEDSFSVGTVTAYNGSSRCADGIGNSFSSISVDNCYYSSALYAGGYAVSSSRGTRTDESNFKSQSWIVSNLGWDFDTVWEFVAGSDYPVLQGFGESAPVEPPHQHSFVETQRTEPTCVDDGLVIRTCSGCGGTSEEVLEKLGHDFAGDVCTRCGAVKPSIDTWDGTADTSWYNSTDTVFTIYTAEQLAGLASLVNGGNTFGGKTVILANDIDLCSREWTPIGKGQLANDVTSNISYGFAGTFDGNNHKISNLEMDYSLTSFGGLFGLLYGDVRALGVEGANVSVSVSNYEIYVGSIAGVVFGGTITGCYSKDCTVMAYSGQSSITGGIVGLIDGDATVSNCYATGEVKCNGYTGGIFGAAFGSYDGGTVTDCYFVGTLYNTGSVANGFITPQVGGIGSLMGSAETHIYNCIFVGTMSSATSSVYFGAINGDDRGRAVNSYYNSSSSFHRSDATSTSLSNIQSQSWIVSTLGWDFDTVWEFVQGNDYPVLQGFGDVEPPHQHSFVETEYIAPTCVSNGLIVNTCTVCGYTTSTELLSPGHDVITHEAKDATCTEIGWDEYVTCSRCDYTTYSEIAPLGHDEITHEAKDATCTEIGWNEYVTCSGCDYTTYSEIAPLGHDKITHEAKDATCTEIGWNEYVTCSGCDYTTYSEIAPLGHDEITHEAKDATCTEIGWDEYVTCSRCDYTTYSEISAKGHSFENGICSYCGEATPVEPDEYILGDINGDGIVNGKDSNMLKQILSGVSIPSESEKIAADVNHDGNVNGVDANLIAQFLAGVLDNF